MPQPRHENAPRRIVVLTGGYTDPSVAKTAISVIRYRGGDVVAVLDASHAGRTAGEMLGVGNGIPVVASLAEAPTATELLVGIAPPGGELPAEWRNTLAEAIARGLDIVSGLHQFLGADPELAAAAAAAARGSSTFAATRSGRWPTAGGSGRHVCGCTPWAPTARWGRWWPRSRSSAVSPAVASTPSSWPPARPGS
jgi:hypothetical protein